MYRKQTLAHVPTTTSTVGERLPSRSNYLLRLIGHLGWWLSGWRLIGELPNIPKLVLIIAPHTSNLDFVLGMFIFFRIGLSANTLVKQSAFRFPMDLILRRLGAIPIDRDKPLGAIKQVIREFRRREQMVVVLAPQGTRAGAGEFKRGFYTIAQGADAPIVLGYLDYKNRVAYLGKTVKPTGDWEADLALIQEFYRDPYRDLQRT